jgi:hypothetical protein
MGVDMTAWDARKAKALLWYWLNFHPAETSHDTEQGFIGLDGEMFEPDMNVYDRDNVVASASHHEAFIDKDSTNWHDVNRAVTDWFGGLRPERKESTFKWLEEVKGKPLDRWQPKYTQAESPHWDSLVKAFKLRRILNGE